MGDTQRFVFSPMFILVSYQSSFNRGKMSAFLYFEIFKNMMFMWIIKN